MLLSVMGLTTITIKERKVSLYTIFSAILTGGYALLNGLGLINTNNTVITEDLKTISSEITEVSSLKIDFRDFEVKSAIKEINNYN